MTSSVCATRVERANARCTVRGTVCWPGASCAAFFERYRHRSCAPLLSGVTLLSVSRSSHLRCEPRACLRGGLSRGGRTGDSARPCSPRVREGRSGLLTGSHMHALHPHACGAFVAAPARACAPAPSTDAASCSAPARVGPPTHFSERERLTASLRAAPHAALAPRTRLLRRSRSSALPPLSSATTPLSSAVAPILEPRQASWVSNHAARL